MLIFIYYFVFYFDNKIMPKIYFDNKIMPKKTDVTATQRLHKSHKTVTYLFVTAKKQLQNENGRFLYT